MNTRSKVWNVRSKVMNAHSKLRNRVGNGGVESMQRMD